MGYSDEPVSMSAGFVAGILGLDHENDDEDSSEDEEEVKMYDGRAETATLQAQLNNVQKQLNTRCSVTADASPDARKSSSSGAAETGTDMGVRCTRHGGTDF